MMQIQSTRDGVVATVEAAGLIDTRAAQEFERSVVGLCNDGVRALIVDLSKVGLITSAGIRVLVMIAQRLQRSGGGLALCALSERVRGVLEIAGLLTQFRITATRDEAIAQLTKIVMTSAAAAQPASRLARLVNRLVAEDEAPPRGPRAAPAGGHSALTARAVDLLQAMQRSGDGETPGGRK
jgi:stage II sporulation protein AA (anti-sigma F factor antagonist)